MMAVGQPVVVARQVGPPMMMPVNRPMTMPQPAPKPKPKEQKPQTIIIKKYYKEEDSCIVF